MDGYYAWRESIETPAGVLLRILVERFRSM